LTTAGHETTASSAALSDFREKVRQWLSTVEIPADTPDLATRFTRLRDWQRVLYAAQLVAVWWPVQWGGRGLTPLHQLVLNEELCRVRAPQPIGLIGLDVVGPSIAKFGTDQQRALLPALLAGEQIWCQGFSEPDAGSDLASIRTSARREGDEFIVSGQKVWTSWGHYADLCALLVRTGGAPGRHGISYLIVDMRSPGITVRPIRQMTGESEFSEIFFDDVHVPVENLVGEVDDGWQIAMDTLSHERGTFALRRQVEITVAFNKCIDALGRSRAEGVPGPSERQIESVGRSCVALEVLNAQNRNTMLRMAKTQAPTALDSIDKLILNRVEQQVFRAMYEFLGPAGGTNADDSWGLDAATMTGEYLYSRAISIYGGTDQIQRNIVAERLLGLPKGA
jgi:alkylation response protein AidB-like acyl-CoA dehydrogenase